MVASVTACQTQTASNSAPTNDTSESESITVDESVLTQVFPDDYAQVCNGIAFDPAKAYEPSAGNVHHLYVFDRRDDNESFTKSYRELPDGWEIPWEESQETQLVACLTVTEETLANTCEFPPEEGETDAYVLETYAVTYDVAIYVAKSGEQLDTTTFDLAGEDCPMFHMFTEGELTDTSIPDYSQALLEFVKPYVQPDA